MVRRNNNVTRSGLRPTSQFVPSIGARHIIAEGSQGGMDTFITNLIGGLQTALGGKYTYDDFGKKVYLTPPYKVFEGEDKAAIRILERRLSESLARKYRIRWNRGDVGLVEQQIAGACSRLALQRSSVEVEFTHAVLVGERSGKHAEGRTIALVPEQSSNAAELFLQEHTFAVEALARKMQVFEYPYEEPYIPHMSIMRMSHGASQDDRRTILGVVEGLMPLRLSFDALTFTAQQQI